MVKTNLLTMCTKCNLRLEVVTVRKPTPDRIRRAKRCPKCGFRLMTEERETQPGAIHPAAALVAAASPTLTT